MWNNKADFSKAKKAARDLLERFAIEKPPINPVAIAQELGLKVWFVSVERIKIAVSAADKCLALATLALGYVCGKSS